LDGIVDNGLEGKVGSISGSISGLKSTSHAVVMTSVRKKRKVKARILFTSKVPFK
jgi:hypothetical protein